MSFFGFEDHNFYRTMKRLAVPLMLQQLVSSSMMVVDNLMIGSLGDNALAALMQANQVTFLFLVFIFGITSATTAFASQFWGNRDLLSIRRTYGLALICGQVIGWAFCILCFFSPQTLLRLFTDEPEVLSLGAQYLNIVCFSYPFIGAGFILGSILRGTGDVKYPMATALTGLCVNVVFNYLLIFGKFGFPQMGIRGAALASMMSQAVDCILLFIIKSVKRMPAFDKSLPIFPIPTEHIKKYFKLVVPVFLNESFWSMAQFTVMLCYARMGTQMSAATGIFNSFDKMGYVIFVGLSNSCAIQCGKAIGEGNLKTAQTYARRYLRIAPSVAVFVALALNLAAPFVMGFYDASIEVKAIALNIVRIYGCMLPVLMFNNMVVVGILRSGGDVRFSLFLDAGFQWTLILIPVALAAFVFHVSPLWIYAFTAPGEIIKLLIGRRRVNSGAWIHTLTYEANV